MELACLPTFLLQPTFWKMRLLFFPASMCRMARKTASSVSGFPVLRMRLQDFGRVLSCGDIMSKGSAPNRSLTASQRVVLNQGRVSDVIRFRWGSAEAYLDEFSVPLRVADLCPLRPCPAALSWPCHLPSGQKRVPALRSQSSRASMGRTTLGGCAMRPLVFRSSCPAFSSCQISTAILPLDEHWHYYVDVVCAVVGGGGADGAGAGGAGDFERRR